MFDANYRRSAIVSCGVWLFVAGACAKSETPPGNGQTHWLQRCEDDADCGDLSCECGVCTIECVRDTSCRALPGLSCRNAATLETASECAGDPAETMLCLTEELAPRLDAGPQPAGDASIMDAEVEDAETEDADVIDPNRPPLGSAMQIGCDAVDADALPTGVELIDEASNSNFSHVRASDQAVAWMTIEGTHYRLSGGELESMVDLLPGFELAGSDAYFVSPTGGIWLHELASGQARPFADDPASSDLYAITPAQDFVFWASNTDGERDLRTIWRSDRENGATIEIGSYRSSEQPYALVPLGDHLYFLRATGGGNIVHRLERAYVDGSEPVEELSPSIDSLANLVTDGTSLFATISPPDTSDGPSPDPHSVVRVSTDGTISTLFETGKIWWYPIYTQLAVDDTYLYWIGRTSVDPALTEQSIWRARKDGTGQPERIADGLADGENFIAINSTTVYVGLNCASAVPILALDKPL